MYYPNSSTMGTKSEIEFIIKPDGKVEFTIKGVKGKQCLPIAELFKVLGDIESEQATAEYYTAEEQNLPRVETHGYSDKA
jgi:hypothetical protein